MRPTISSPCLPARPQTRSRWRTAYVGLLRFRLTSRHRSKPERLPSPQDQGGTDRGSDEQRDRSAARQVQQNAEVIADERPGDADERAGDEAAIWASDLS